MASWKIRASRAAANYDWLAIENTFLRSEPTKQVVGGSYSVDITGKMEIELGPYLRIELHIDNIELTSSMGMT